MMNWIDQVQPNALSSGAVGLLAARPAASSVAAGTRYLATDASGTLYESNHVTWSTVTPPQWGRFLDEATGVVYVFNGTAYLEETSGGGTGAPTDAPYLVTTSNGDLSAEVVVGATPGGELGGTWASPTVAATHSGSAHHTRSHDHSNASDGNAVAPATLTIPAGTAGANLTTLPAHDHTGDAGDGGQLAYGSALTGTPTIPIANSATSAVLTSDQTLSSADTLTDLGGMSVSCVAGTWELKVVVTFSMAAAVTYFLAAIADGSNTDVLWIRGSVPTTSAGTYTLSGSVIVTPGSTTTYKARGQTGRTDPVVKKNGGSAGQVESVLIAVRLA